MSKTWDSIVADQGALSVTADQRHELDRRLGKYMINKNCVRLARDVVKDIPRQLRGRCFGPDVGSQKPYGRLRNASRLAPYGGLARQSRRGWRLRLGIRLSAPSTFDPLRQPVLHFTFQPAYRSVAQFDPLWETSLGLELVDHRAAQPGDLTHLGQAQRMLGRRVARYLGSTQFSFRRLGGGFIHGGSLLHGMFVSRNS